jgi:hypothetical protein
MIQAAMLMAISASVIGAVGTLLAQLALLLAATAIQLFSGKVDNVDMYPLHHKSNHLFVQIDQHLWLLDTGSPTSFGTLAVLCMQGRVFQLPNEYQGMGASELSAYVGVDCAGLIGVDIINQFDLLLDVPGGTIDFMLEDVPYTGQEIPVAHYMGIPVLQVYVAGQSHEMFLDTGAQLSYLQDEVLIDFPEAGQVRDFYHGYGEFEVSTHHVSVIIGNRPYNMRFGHLPQSLGTAVLSRGPRGIIGNEWLSERRLGYFPSRNAIVIDPVPLAGFKVIQHEDDQSQVIH